MSRNPVSSGRLTIGRENTPQRNLKNKLKKLSRKKLQSIAHPYHRTQRRKTPQKLNLKKNALFGSTRCHVFRKDLGCPFYHLLDVYLNGRFLKYTFAICVFSSSTLALCLSAAKQENLLFVVIAHSRKVIA